MPIFEISNHKLIPIGKRHIDLERNLQTLTENNLQVVFGLDFISGSLNQEFRVRTAQQEFYIDTLAFDPQTKSFVIIEYKKDKSFSVIDQGYAYLAAMLSHKADFILEYIDKKQVTGKPDIDWRQSKILFLSTQFTSYQESAIAFKDLPIELWKVTLYANKTISYDKIKAPGARGSFDEVAPKSRGIQSVARKMKPYTVQEMFDRYKTSPQIRDLFNKIRVEISSMANDFDHRIGKSVAIYSKGYKTFAYLIPKAKEVQGMLRLSDVRVPSEIAKPRQVRKGDPFKIAFRIKSEAQLTDALSLIKEAYESLSSELNA